MPTQPTDLPRWATDGGTTLEPISGQKDTGWAFDDQPPARHLNWLLNVNYQWAAYLQTPVGTGAGPGLEAEGGPTAGTGLKGNGGTDGVGVHGLGDGTSEGVLAEGGGTSGKGVNAVGGGTGPGGQFLGGSSGADGIISTGRLAFAGVSGIGGVTDNSIGVEGTSSAAIGHGVKGTATGSGVGVEGVSDVSGIGVRGDGNTSGIGVSGVGGSASGHGVTASADASSPVSSALAITPQDTDPSSSSAGDVYVNSVNGRMSVRGLNGFERVVTRSQVKTDVEEVGINSSGFNPVFFPTSGRVSIPANTLRVGSVIKVRVAGRIISNPAQVGEIGFAFSNVTTGAVLDVRVRQGVAGNNEWVFTLMATVRTIGASGTISIAMDGSYGNGILTQAEAGSFTVDNATIDTTAVTNIDVGFGFNITTNSVGLQQLVAEIT